jgi:membrane-associated phospholipid phosphatase
VHRRWRLALLALGCLTLAWVFAKLGGEVLEGELFALDNAMRGWMLAHRSHAGIAIFSVITLFGAKELLAPLGLLLAWWLFRDVKRLGAVLAFAALAAGEFVAVLKRDLHVMRPAGGKLAGLGYSFPSGHATGSMAIGVVLSYVALRTRIHPGAIATTSAITVVLVGVSRVYLDVHWTSDVLGGWLIGAAFGAGVCSLYELLRTVPSTDAARSP